MNGCGTDGKVAYVVIHMMIDNDNIQNPYADAKVFGSLAKAKKYVKTDFDKTMKSIFDGCTVLDVISATNRGTSADIELGERDEERLFDDDHSTVSTVHLWRISVDTSGKTAD